ncbi:unnamed protein product [Gadus morhua 'NCC']
MFSVAVLLLLLAAGSGVNCEQLTQPESLTVRPGQPLTIRCQRVTVLETVVKDEQKLFTREGLYLNPPEDQRLTNIV